VTSWLEPVAAGVVRPALAAEVISPAYDLMTVREREEYAARVPRSFLNGTPSSEAEDPGADAAARRTGAREYLAARLAEETWVEHPPSYYVYRIESGAHVQTGVVGDVAASHFPGLVKPHEHTRPARVADLVDYLAQVGYGSSPVALTYRRIPEIDGLVALVTGRPPILDVVLPDGDRQQIWLVDAGDAARGLQSAFAGIDASYIVDGHHRVAATLQRGGDPSTAAGRFLAVVFPHDDLAVHPFHRWLAVEWTPTTGALPGPGRPHPGMVVAVTRAGEFELHLNGNGDDATLLARQVMARLGVTDERVDPRVTFVPGYPGPEALRQKVERDGGVGFLLHPPTVETVMATSDAGGVMPPKATFFAPKPRSGVFLVRR
jgi:uncharacterized protein (DUF1015 family)